VLADPQNAKGFPQPDPIECDDIDCKNKSRFMDMCPHELENLYEESRLNGKEYRNEYRRFHPNRGAVYQIPKPYREEALKMVTELTFVLDKFRNRTAK